MDSNAHQCDPDLIVSQGQEVGAMLDGTIEHPRLIRRIHDIRSFDRIVNAEPLGDLVPGEDARRGSAG
jgi:hypothetical protein